MHAPIEPIDPQHYVDDAGEVILPGEPGYGKPSGRAQCQHCGEPFHPHGQETFCSAFCAFQHLQAYYAAYGMGKAPTAHQADEWYHEAQYRTRAALGRA